MPAVPMLSLCPFSVDKPGGLRNRVFASSAEDELPAESVPMPRMLCSLWAKPAAMAWVYNAPTATASAVFNQVVFIVLLLRDESASEPSNFLRQVARQ